MSSGGSGSILFYDAYDIDDDDNEMRKNILSGANWNFRNGVNTG
jgi:hypothetical protein